MIDSLTLYINQNLTKKTFEELSLSHQKAIIQWMVIDGEDWADLIPEIFFSSYNDGWKEDEWHSVISEIVKHKGLTEFTFVSVPTEYLTDYIFKNNPYINDDYQSWQEYHQSYIKTDMPDHSISNPWACFFSFSDDEVILDGWHRLHCYVKNKMTEIPLIIYD